MARSVRDSNLDTRTSRLKLPIGKRHWKAIGKGVAIGYRRTQEGFGSWSVRTVTPDGKYHIETIGMADDYQDADGAKVLDFFQAQDKCRAHAEEQSALWGGMPRKPITVAEAAEHYLDWFRLHKRSYKETRYTIETHILPGLGERLVGELRAPEIRKWHERVASTPPRLRTRPGSKQKFGERPATADEKRARKASANRILTVLKAILNKAFHDELVPDDTAWRLVKPFKNADEPVIRFLTEQEATRLVNACRPDFRLLVKAALFTGARYSELTRLRGRDVNLSAGMVFVTPDSKSNKGRHIPLSGTAKAFFQEQLAGKLGNDLVFTKQDGAEWGKSHQVRVMHEACAAAHVQPRISFHDLRHCYASALAQRGVDLLTISKLLGHADTRITSRHYAHLCDSVLRKAVENVPGYGHEPDAKVKVIG
jgi:integrase